MLHIQTLRTGNVDTILHLRLHEVWRHKVLRQGPVAVRCRDVQDREHRLV